MDPATGVPSHDHGSPAHIHVPHHESPVHFPHHEYHHHDQRHEPHVPPHKPHHPGHGEPGYPEPPPDVEPPPYYDDPNRVNPANQTFMDDGRLLSFQRRYERRNNGHGISVSQPERITLMFLVVICFGFLMFILSRVDFRSHGNHPGWPVVVPRPYPPGAGAARVHVEPCHDKDIHPDYYKTDAEQVPFPAYLVNDDGDDNNDEEKPQPQPNPPKTPPARKVTRHEIFGSIDGHFDLYDLLDLQTITGSIDVTITPRPGREPAILRVHSATGSVTVRLSTEFLGRARNVTVRDGRYKVEDVEDTDFVSSIARRFETDIGTHTGTVSMMYLVGGGGRTSVSSQTGSLELDLLTVGVGRDDLTTTLTTLTQPGSQSIAVRPLVRDGGKISKLHAEHSGQGFGGLNIVYPAEWEGDVEATVQGVGNISVDGEGLQIVEQRSLYIKARRGDGDSKVEIVGQGSGEIVFRC